MGQSCKNKTENENRVNAELVKRSAAAQAPAPQPHRVTAAGWSLLTPRLADGLGSPVTPIPLTAH